MSCNICLDTVRYKWDEKQFIYCFFLFLVEYGKIQDRKVQTFGLWFINSGPILYYLEPISPM